MESHSHMHRKPHIGMDFGSLMPKKRKLLMLREKVFLQKGTLILEHKLKNVIGSLIVFRAKELERATMNFAENMILGRGSYGIVYKGILPDKRVVVIKRSKISYQGQLEHFINEIVILRQINHRNVVQLLGCCLETEIPFLAYEFSSNYSLYHHIHNKENDTRRLSWDSRLRIAHESAGALAYLHSDLAMPIIHGDVKSGNILLDENYTAKVSDFGASKLVPLGHDQVFTLVQGTLGYVDPEYFHTSQLTDKSDVYSFGVVLVELLTGLNPIDSERCQEDRILATYFLKAERENRLPEIVDHQVLEEATDKQLEAAYNLVHRCLDREGGNRPSMKQVSMELERIRKFSKLTYVKSIA